MYYPIAKNPELSPEQINGDLLDFEDALHDVQAHPPGGSQVVRLFGKAGVELLHDPERPEFREVSSTFVSDRPDLLASHKVQLMWRSFQYFWMDNPSYSITFDSQAALETGIQDVLTDPPKRDILQQEILALRTNQTNEPRRYAGPKLAIGLYKDLLPQPFSSADIGTSRGLGPAQMQLGMPFSHIEIKENPFMDRQENLALNQYIRHKIAGKLALSYNVGVDRDLNTDVRWAEACGYYPEEWATPEKKNTRKMLYAKLRALEESEQDLPMSERRFQLVWGDVVDTNGHNLDDVRAVVPGGVYDVAMAVTSLYEVPAAQTRQALAGLESLAGRLAIVQDFAEIDPDDATSLKFAEDIYAPTSRYNLFAKPMVDQNEPWRHLGTWNTGRARAFTPSPLIRDFYEAEQHQAS